jgi:hypothetical protein
MRANVWGREPHTTYLCFVRTLRTPGQLTYKVHCAGEKVDGHLVFDDNTPTPRVVRCHSQSLPEALRRPSVASNVPGIDGREYSRPPL